jgi:hypothetical protein
LMEQNSMRENIWPDEGTHNPDSTHGVYISKTLSQETIFSNTNFIAWSLSNIPPGSSLAL